MFPHLAISTAILGPTGSQAAQPLDVAPRRLKKHGALLAQGRTVTHQEVQRNDRGAGISCDGNAIFSETSKGTHIHTLLIE